MGFWLGAAVVASVAGSALSGAQARSAAKDQEAYNARVEAQKKAFRLEAMNYQNEQYQADTDHYGRLIGYQKDEFAKYKDYAERQFEVVDENFADQLRAQMQRIAEIDIAAYLDMEDVNFQEDAALGTLRVATAEAGVAGNSARLLEGEVRRQGGTGRVAVALQHKANRRQALLETTSLKANRDTALSQIRVPTFQPMQAPQPPAPIDPVNPAAPVGRPSVASVLVNAASGGLNTALSFRNGQS